MIATFIRTSRLATKLVSDGTVIDAVGAATLPGLERPAQ